MRFPTLNAYAFLITLLSLWLAKPSQISSVVKGNLYLHQMNYDKDFYDHKTKEITIFYLHIFIILPIYLAKVLFIFRCSKNWQKKSSGNHLLSK